ncbi:hypothetical protein HYH03_002587 [Edaphochlamys debaryana]|uniref:Uncharacterized protein n=1 Tax=Edaphochlamys debaryana TaxID=47281 RepID=A0A836C560_9CHLO|nr:hypothetical protein HYH03_002587 [Edaphochlamys debaryana]KAG2499649.1 hypothetical protein HYH03_002587 [Edaphochlamys debaryana]|eukprot:KAG2499648.1 hypothetical protein HYH03_002587 [Edaphochlamys debaryana]
MGDKAWSSGLCGCFSDCGSCLYTYFCPCCSFGSNVAKLGGDEVYCGGSCVGACCCYDLLYALGCCCLYHMKVRGAIRRKYGIAGSDCNDCMLAFFCPVCSICQEARQLKSG